MTTEGDEKRSDINVCLEAKQIYKELSRVREFKITCFLFCRCLEEKQRNTLKIQTINGFALFIWFGLMELLNTFIAHYFSFKIKDTLI